MRTDRAKQSDMNFILRTIRHVGSYHVTVKILYRVQMLTGCRCRSRAVPAASTGTGGTMPWCRYLASDLPGRWCWAVGCCTVAIDNVRCRILCATLSY